MTTRPDPAGADQLVTRDQLSSLQGLLVLSMLMTESGDEQRILHLASTSVPSLGECRLEGVYLLSSSGQVTTNSCADPDTRADLEAQFAVLGSAGGAVAIVAQTWSWAYPLRSLGGDFGYLVVGADSEPPPSTQFLLRVLAQQTGIALANAQLHMRDTAIASELRSANVALAETVMAFERSKEIHARLTRVAVEGEGQTGVARAVHELTGHPVVIEDRHGNVRAWAGPQPPDPRAKDPPDRRANTLQRALREGRPIRDGDRLLAVARPAQDLIGVLVIKDPGFDAGFVDEIALEHGATVLAMELARLQSLEETELRLGRDLVEELLRGTDDDTALNRAQLRGYDLARPHRVVVVEAHRRASTDDDSFFNAVRRAARDAEIGSLLVAHSGAVVVLADAERPWETFRSAIVKELGGGDCRVGVGGSCDRPVDFPRSYHEAELALKVQRAAGYDRATVFDELGIYGLLAEIEDSSSLERFAREWLGALLDYDEQKGGAELVMTLAHYLECGGNQANTAVALSVHRNTVKYRLQRVREISGHDLTDPDTSFNLQLAARVWQTLLALRN